MDTRMQRRLTAARLITRVNRAADEMAAAGLATVAANLRTLTLRPDQRSARAVARRLNQAFNSASTARVERLDVCHTTRDPDHWQEARQALHAAEAASRSAQDLAWEVECTGKEWTP